MRFSPLCGLLLPKCRKEGSSPFLKKRTKKLLRRRICGVLVPLLLVAAGPRDVPFAGVITLAVDATDTVHKVFRVHERIPVPAAGPAVLLFPQWELDSHAPTGSAASLAGLIMHAGAARLEWQRDMRDPFAFHVAVPAGAAAIDLDFQFLSAPSPRQGAMLMTPDMMDVQWQNLLLYPAGWFVRDIAVQATLRLPGGFQAATSLATAAAGPGASLSFRPVPLDTLVDSPVYAGRYVRRFPLSEGGAPEITLDVMADDPSGLAIAPQRLDALKAMLLQARGPFPKPPFARYDFLVALSDALPGPGGAEHLQSSEDVLPHDFFTHDGAYLVDRDLLAHEYVHAWNGRSRQPADLWAPDFNTPVRDSLLWVYEGQTEFWGRVLAARAGLRSRQQTLDALAADAATGQARTGREWKSLQDSTNDPIYMAGHSVPWRDWQRREDYYGEGVLLWLDVDMRLRQQTAGRRSLDDFARLFFAGSEDHKTSTYTFEDVCAALQTIAPFDWTGFLRHRLDTHDSDGLLDGLQRGGYRLVFTGTPTAYFVSTEEDNGVADLSYSIGLSVTDKGGVRSVAWDGPAFRAGLSVGAQIMKVNGKDFSPDVLKAAVDNASTAPLRLTITMDGKTTEATIAYQGQLRYPRLERLPNKPPLLDPLLAPT